jgi:hypothetical protein
MDQVVDSTSVVSGDPQFVADKFVDVLRQCSAVSTLNPWWYR